MAEQERSRADRVAALANRLRLLQIDFADQTEDVRRGYLIEEVRRAVATVVPSERTAFLKELEARFPTWDANVQIVAGPAAPAFDEKELKDPSFLIKRLVEVYATLPEIQQRVVTERLKEAKIVGVGKAEWPQASATDLRTKLQLTAQEEIVAHRLLDLMTVVAEFVYSLDHVVWQTWRQVAPQADIRRPSPLQRTMGRFVAGDEDVPRGQVTQDLGKLRQLIAAFVGAVSQTGRFAIQHFNNFSPDNIKVLVGTGGFGDGRYWKKYVELAGAMDAASTEDAIRKEIAEYIERLMRGR